jgi:aspartyl-tRNA(Asn)/glutamyl-tRNA(Gln) amidotransferase subunit A
VAETGELSFATITELRAMLDRRTVSSRELTTHFLDRLERIGPTYNALAALTRDRALEEADAADRELARGRSSPLLGIPYGAKDLLAARGAPTIWGSGAYRDQVLDFDAAAIERLRAAGAPLLGKLALMELAGLHGGIHASVHGPGLNPWDTSRWACGSSSGSGSAVAAGLVPFALGSETGGSIGSPSAFCGITGLRPTFGLVSRYGAMPLAPSLDKVGPMGRTVTDVATVLEAIAGFDARDPGSARGHDFRRADAAVVRESRRGRPWRVAFAPYDLEQGADEPLRPVLRDAMAQFEALGVEFVESELPPELAYYKIIEGVVFGEGTASFRELIESERLELVTDADQRTKLRETLSMPAYVYLDAMREREKVRAAFDAIFRDVDAIFTYTLPWEPHPIVGEFSPVAPTQGFTGMVAASNLADLPALFLPVGLTEHRLPVGVQLVGPRFSEASLVALGEAFQAATAFHALRPPMTDVTSPTQPAPAGV